MKRKKKLLWQIYLPFLAIIIISLFLTSWHASRTLRSLYIENQIDALQIRSQLLEPQVLIPLINEQYAKTDSICKALGKQVNTRFTLILPSGLVIGDTRENPNVMDNHADRPEIRKAFQTGEMGTSTRYSYTLDLDMLYVAIPVENNGTRLAVIRSSKPLIDLSESLEGFFQQITFAVLLITLLSAIVALFMSHRINRPIYEMTLGAERFGKGELDHRLFITQSGELRELAEAMNNMAEQLSDRIRKVTLQRNEIQAILSSMVEAIVAVDTGEHIIRFNHAAGELFDIEEEDAYDKHIGEVVRNTSLMDFILQALKSDSPMEGEIQLLEKHQFLQAHGTILRDAESRRIGALIVLNDITKQRHLESIRKDFVSNVSHELKTPITSIKGFVETLREGAINDRDNANRFIDIISKHTDRLNAIIEDLLKLSSLEHEDAEPIELKCGPIDKVVKDAILICEQKAKKKNVTLKWYSENSVSACINAPLLEEALVNLLDNAIKFSSEKGQIDISATQEEVSANIVIRDYGSGIEQKHLPRIFERFYRVDKSRNREIGGTGLGLAIVKHIAQAHNGHVTVESKLGEGSTFTITIPTNEQSDSGKAAG